MRTNFDINYRAIICNKIIHYQEVSKDIGVVLFTDMSIPIEIVPLFAQLFVDMFGLKLDV